MAGMAAYVVDFDGTVTTEDLSTKLAMYCGGQAYLDIENAYRSREMTIKQWLQRIIRLFPADIDMLLSKAFEWADIRPGFESFLKFADQHNRPVYIASDGLGFYIKPILENQDLLGYIKAVHCNETTVNSSGILQISNPFAHQSCAVCGNCKANLVVKLKDAGYPVIYIGDGSNDRFGAFWSDQICARDHLVDTCRRHGFDYKAWNDYYDIVKVIAPQLTDCSERALCCPQGSGIRV